MELKCEVREPDFQIAGNQKGERSVDEKYDVAVENFEAKIDHLVKMEEQLTREDVGARHKRSLLLEGLLKVGDAKVSICHRVPRQACKQVVTGQQCSPQQQCKEVTVQRCKDVPHTDCYLEPMETCQKVPRQECSTDYVTTCRQVIVIVLLLVIT